MFCFSQHTSAREQTRRLECPQREKGSGGSQANDNRLKVETNRTESGEPGLSQSPGVSRRQVAMVIIAHCHDASSTSHTYLSVRADEMCLVCVEELGKQSPTRTGRGGGFRHLSCLNVCWPSTSLRFTFSFLDFLFFFFFRFPHQQSFPGSLQEPPSHQHPQQRTSKQATKKKPLKITFMRNLLTERIFQFNVG